MLLSPLKYQEGEGLADDVVDPGYGSLHKGGVSQVFPLLHQLQLLVKLVEEGDPVR